MTRTAYDGGHTRGENSGRARHPHATPIIDNYFGTPGDDAAAAPSDHSWNARGYGGDDTLTGGGGYDAIGGNTGDDLLYGMGGDDRVNGAAGEDRLDGGAGSDVLVGGGGNDELIPGTGRDAMRGGEGADRFVFVSLDDSPVGRGGYANASYRGDFDRITDFDPKGGDRIDLSAIDAIAGGADDAFTLSSDGFHVGIAGLLRVTNEGFRTIIDADVDGDAIPDFAIVLDGQPGITVNAFLL